MNRAWTARSSGRRTGSVWRVFAPWFALLALAAGCWGAAAPPVSPESPAPDTLVIGFMGGYVRPDDRRHPEVELAERLRDAYGKRVYVELFENRRRADARHAVLKLLDRDGDGRLSGEEKRDARIVLLGHSWGAAEVILLARDLERDGVPVSLTIQVDSISKPGKNDWLVPANVAEAVNFYQPRGILHGRSRIEAADPARTRILGNYRFEYKRPLAGCHEYSWFARLLSRDHIAIECDPQIWSEVEGLIRTRLSPEPSFAGLSGK